MEVSAHVVQALQPLQPQFEPLEPDLGDIAEDDGILPNQQIIAQELLSRVLIVTGNKLTVPGCICYAVSVGCMPVREQQNLP